MFTQTWEIDWRILRAFPKHPSSRKYTHGLKLPDLSPILPRFFFSVWTAFVSKHISATLWILFHSIGVGDFLPPSKPTRFPRQKQHPVRNFNSLNQMIPQSQFNERSKNQIKSNKEIPSSPAASSLLPLPTQPAALESIKEMGAEQLCPYTAKHKVKHMEYATHSAFALLFSLTHWKGQWQAQREHLVMCSTSCNLLKHASASSHSVPMDCREHHKSCRALPVCPWAGLSFPRPSKAKPILHGNQFFIQISFSTAIAPATPAKYQEAQSRTQGGSCSPCSTPETPSLGCGPEVPGHGRARSLHQDIATEEPPLLSLSAAFQFPTSYALSAKSNNSHKPKYFSWLKIRKKKKNVLGKTPAI